MGGALSTASLRLPGRGAALAGGTPPLPRQPIRTRWLPANDGVPRCAGLQGPQCERCDDTPPPRIMFATQVEQVVFNQKRAQNNGHCSIFFNLKWNVNQFFMFN